MVSEEVAQVGEPHLCRSYRMLNILFILRDKGEFMEGF